MQCPSGWQHASIHRTLPREQTCIMQLTLIDHLQQFNYFNCLLVEVQCRVLPLHTTQVTRIVNMCGTLELNIHPMI